MTEATTRTPWRLKVHNIEACNCSNGCGCQCNGFPDYGNSIVDQPGPGTSQRICTGLHICRCNWSRNDATLPRGSYHPLAPYLERINVHQLVLEYATER